MKKLIIVIFILFAVLSCTDFTSPERYDQQSYYLTGLLQSGKCIDFENPVIFGRTVPVEGGSINDLIIFDAVINLHQLDADDQIVASAPLAFNVNPADEEEFGYIDEFNLLSIVEEARYKIEAVIDQDTVWAETIVPKLITVLDDPGYSADTLSTGWPEMSYDTIETEHPIMIQTQDDEVLNLYMKFYCLEYWEEAEYIYAFGDITSPEKEEDYENPGDGSPRKSVIFYTFKPQNNIIDFSFYRYAFTFYGKHEVTVSSIDDNYLNYLYKPEGYNHGGIHGGLGYFGSAVSQKMYTKITE